MSYYDFIMVVKNMKSINKICEENNIDVSNLLKGTASKDNIKKVANDLKLEIIKLYALFDFIQE